MVINSPAPSRTLPPLIVMGVSGSGKSTIGRSLADELGMQFIDGDDLHPRANREKMAAGLALTDEDRAPWLDIIADRIGAEFADGNPIIVACSALKRRYRTQLRSQALQTVFIHLVGEPSVIAERQSRRSHEYMPDSLLASQFATLEPLAIDERGIIVDLTQAPAAIIRRITDQLSAFRSP